jgi:hypothetical protein
LEAEWIDWWGVKTAGVIGIVSDQSGEVLVAASLQPDIRFVNFPFGPHPFMLARFTSIVCLVGHGVASRLFLSERILSALVNDDLSSKPLSYSASLRFILTISSVHRSFPVPEYNQSRLLLDHIIQIGVNSS